VPFVIDLWFVFPAAKSAAAANKAAQAAKCGPANAVAGMANAVAPAGAPAVAAPVAAASGSCSAPGAAQASVPAPSPASTPSKGNANTLISLLNSTSTSSPLSASPQQVGVAGAGMGAALGAGLGAPLGAAPGAAPPKVVGRKSGPNLMDVQVHPQRVTMSALANQLAQPAQQSVDPASLLQHPTQLRFSSPSRQMSTPNRVQAQQLFDVDAASGGGVAGVADSSNTNSTPVPLYEISPSNFNSLVSNLTPSDLASLENPVTLDSLTSPTSSPAGIPLAATPTPTTPTPAAAAPSPANAVANFDLQNFVDSAVGSNSVPTFEMSVTNNAPLHNFEISLPSMEAPTVDTIVSSAVPQTFQVSQVVQNAANNINDFANQMNQAASYQISIPDLDSTFENADTIRVQNSFDFSNFTAVPVNSSNSKGVGVAVSTGMPVSATGHVVNTNVSSANLLSRILSGGSTANAAIRRLSTNAINVSALNNDVNSNAHGLTALSALLAGN